MPQYYKRKPNTKPRNKIDEEKMKLAVLEVLRKEKGVSTVAKAFGVDRMTLKRYVRKYEENPNVKMTSNFKKRLIFTETQEKELSEYLKICAKMNSGLNYIKTRKLAYELAVKNSIARPNSWDRNLIAGADWMKSFMKRNSSLSLRTPEATSLSRGTSFNKKKRWRFLQQFGKYNSKRKFYCFSYMEY